MKIAIIGFAAGTALLLAGCSGSSDDDTSAAPDASASPTTTALAGDETKAPDVGNLDDPLCAAASESVDDAEAITSKTSDLTTMLQDPTFLTGGDTAALNQWGNDMLTLVSSTKGFYETGVQETAGEAVNADFATLSTFVTQYSTALAQAAADAKSTTEFMSTISTLFTDSDSQAAVAAAPAAAQNVATYLGTRCDLVG